MLGKLFGSNARVKILKIFLLHPDQKYYIRQLSRDLKLQVNSVRRELENLELFGLLVSNTGSQEEPQEQVDSLKKAKGGQEKKYFQAHKDFVLFEEIKALIVKAQVLYERDFIDKLKKIGSIKLFVLSGIFVNNKDSAVDLLIVGRFNKDRFNKLVKNLESDLGKEIKYTLMDTKEFKYRKDVTDIFLYDVLEGKNIVVVDEIGLS